jgi:zinc transport system ATP-binding protein
MNNDSDSSLLQPSASPACGVCCTRIVDLGVRIGSTTILEHVNLHMHCGQLTVLIGPNGAGKTTLLRAMMGEIPHTGELRFIPTHKKDSRRKKPRIGYVPQKLDMDALSPVTVHDLFAGAIFRRPVWSGVSRRASQSADEQLNLVGADGLQHKKLGQLSCGQLQRVMLALALTPIPEILLLDEPISGMDQAGILLFYQIVSRLRRDYDLSVLLISHDLGAAARFADRMVFLNKTILHDGAPSEVLSQPLVRQTFGLDYFSAQKNGAPPA